MIRNLLRSTLGLTSLFSALTLVSTAQAQVAITPSVSFDGSLYTYNYSVTNNTTDTLALTTFNVRPVVNAVTLNPANFPTGFFVSFDPGLGLVSFLEDTDPNTLPTFAPGSTISGFTFTSPYQPTTSAFEALDINGNSFVGTTLAPNNVPEPGPAALGLACGLGTLCFVRTRRGRKVTHA